MIAHQAEDGTITLEWAPGQVAANMTRELVENIVEQLNERASLRSQLQAAQEHKATLQRMVTERAAEIERLRGENEQAWKEAGEWEMKFRRLRAVMRTAEIEGAALTPEGTQDASPCPKGIYKDSCGCRHVPEGTQCPECGSPKHTGETHRKQVAAAQRSDRRSAPEGTQGVFDKAAIDEALDAPFRFDTPEGTPTYYESVAQGVPAHEYESFDDPPAPEGTQDPALD